MSKPILCLDFDGVIHSYTSGWKGADVISDPPVKGAAIFLRRAINYFRVCIYSSRSGQKGGIEAMQNYVAYILEEVFTPEMSEDIYRLLEWPIEKPPAMISIDDRALTFTGEWPDINKLLAFKPWNKQ